jgi:hypothetical protein
VSRATITDGPADPGSEAASANQGTPGPAEVEPAEAAQTEASDPPAKPKAKKPRAKKPRAETAEAGPQQDPEEPKEE